jgi:hypothetical protein
MFTMSRKLIAVGSLMAFASVAYAGSDWLKGSTEDQLKSLAQIQPGLGTVMIEYGNRITTMYYSAKGGNWGMAGYQLKEAREIQEVGETTRPNRAGALKSFETHYLEPLDEAIKAKDWHKFDTAFHKAVEGCNQCHENQDFPYIKYELPAHSLSPTSVKP